METVIKTIKKKGLNLLQESEIINALPSLIDTDFPEFDGDNFSLVSFCEEIETENFHVTIQGEFMVKWTSYDEYEYDDMTEFNVSVFDDNGDEVEVSNDLVNKIDNNIEFSIL